MGGGGGWSSATAPATNSTRNAGEASLRAISRESRQCQGSILSRKARSCVARTIFFGGSQARISAHVLDLDLGNLGGQCVDLGRAEVALSSGEGSAWRGVACGLGLGFVELGLAIQVKPHALLIVGHWNQPPAVQLGHVMSFPGRAAPSPYDIRLRGFGPNLSGSEDLSS